MSVTTKPVAVGRQRGQVLPFASVFLALCAALFFYMVNAGQMTVEKTRALNAADAAAYSAGVVQARGLNFAAYSNRAIIANQVAIAQALTITNWLVYAGSLMSATSYGASGAFANGVGRASMPVKTEQMERYLKLSSMLAASWVAQFYGFEPDYYVEYLQEIFAIVGSVVISANNVASLGLESAEYATLGLGGAELWARSSTVADKVVNSMDPKLKATINPVGLLSGGIGSIVKEYSDDDRERLQRIVLDSLDQRTKERNWDVDRVPNGILDAGMHRRGHTWMPDLDNWKADDKLYSEEEFFKLFGGIKTDSEDIAYSRAIIGDDDDAPEIKYYRNSYSEQEVNYFYGIYSGMASVFDVADPDSTEALQHRAGVTVYVHKNKQDTHTSGHVSEISPGGQFAMFGEDGGRDIAGMSRAEILFNPPPRSDGKTEYPNLYNPYWTTRLTAPLASDYVAYGLSSLIR